MQREHVCECVISKFSLSENLPLILQLFWHGIHNFNYFYLSCFPFIWNSSFFGGAVNKTQLRFHALVLCHHLGTEFKYRSCNFRTVFSRRKFAQLSARTKQHQFYFFSLVFKFVFGTRVSLFCLWLYTYWNRYDTHDMSSTIFTHNSVIIIFTLETKPLSLKWYTFNGRSRWMFR